MTTQRPRFPFPRYPTGWFQVAWSSDVEPGQSIPLKYFGQDLVLFRKSSGELAVLHAYCPHMGAHLGHGGVVDEQDNIVCPFHAWTFDSQGDCVEIPYAEKVPKKAKVACWTVQEKNDVILVWHDSEGGPPSWEIPSLPEFEDEAWSETWHRQWRIRTHNQEMCENMVDVAHFKYLHGTKNLPEASVERDGPVLRMNTTTVMETPAGEVTGDLSATAYGFGYSINRFSGLVDTLLSGAVVPVDEEYVDVRFTFMVKRIGGHSITRGVGKAFVAEIQRQLEQDTPVWENKVYIDPPLLCSGDGPVGMFRQWCKQFYPAEEYARTYEAFYGRPLPRAKAG